MTQPKRFSESLTCSLTDPEVAERADHASRLQYDHDEIASDIAQRKKSAKERMDALDAKRRRLLDEVRTRQGYQPVECERVPDFAAGVLRTVRLDTGEVLRVRELTAEERQKKLFLDDDYPDDVDAAELEETEELEFPDGAAGKPSAEGPDY